MTKKKTALRVLLTLAVLAAGLTVFVLLMPSLRNRLWLGLAAGLLVSLLLCYIAPIYDLPKAPLTALRRCLLVLAVGLPLFSIALKTEQIETLRFQLLAPSYRQAAVLAVEDTQPHGPWEEAETSPWLALNGSLSYLGSGEETTVYFPLHYSLFDDVGLLYAAKPETLPRDFGCKSICWIEPHWAYVQLC